MSSPVSAGMGNRLPVGQLSLDIPLWAGVMSTSISWGVHGQAKHTLAPYMCSHSINCCLAEGYIEISDAQGD